MSHATKPARPPVAGRPQLARMPALIILVYAVAVYLLFLAVLGYAAGFFAGLGVPKGIDQGTRAAVPVAVAIDLLLLSAVRGSAHRDGPPVVQAPLDAHRARARRTDELRLGRDPGAGAAVLAVAAGRRGSSGACRDRAPYALWAGYAAGWAAAVSSTFLISHFDLFGVRQAWLHARRVRYSPPPFTERGVYRRIRHPLMAGFVVIFWSAPVMTAGHLLFAAAATGYILAGIAFEEHDLVQQPGRHLRRVPGPRARADPPAPAPASFARVSRSGWCVNGG